MRTLLSLSFAALLAAVACHSSSVTAPTAAPVLEGGPSSLVLVAPQADRRLVAVPVVPGISCPSSAPSITPPQMENKGSGWRIALEWGANPAALDVIVRLTRRETLEAVVWKEAASKGRGEVPVIAGLWDGTIAYILASPCANESAPAAFAVSGEDPDPPAAIVKPPKPPVCWYCHTKGGKAKGANPHA